MNKKDIESMQGLYESVITEAGLDHRTINSLIAVVLKSYDKGDYEQALKDLEGLKGFRTGGGVTALDLQPDVINGLEAKIMAAIADKEESDSTAKTEEKKERSLNTIFERAKAGIFTYAQLGYMNGWTDGDKCYQILSLHYQWATREPSKHHTREIPQGRAIHEYRCTCGFEYGVDSSD